MPVISLHQRVTAGATPTSAPDATSTGVGGADMRQEALLGCSVLTEQGQEGRRPGRPDPETSSLLPSHSLG